MQKGKLLEKLISIFTFASLILSSLVPLFSPQLVSAATLTDLTVTPASTALGQATAYTISFTAQTALSAPTNVPNGPMIPGGNIHVSFHSRSGSEDEGYQIDVSSATLGSGSSISGEIDREYEDSVTGLNIALSSAVSTGSTVTIVLEGVANPAAGKAGSYGFHVSTFEQGSEADSGDAEAFYLGFGAMTKTVSGKVTLSTGAVATDASINANKKGGGGEGLFINTDADSAGNYSMSLPGGEWEFNISPQWDKTTGQQKAVNWAYMQQGPPPSVSFAEDSSTQTATVNFSVVSATATVTGKVALPDGTPASRGGIDVRSAEGLGAGGGFNDQGVFLVKVPAGTYTLGAFIEDSSYALPKQSPFTVSENETKNFGTLTLAKKNEHIQGVVTDKDAGAGVAGVSINAWGQTGWGQTTTGSNGTYDLLVSPGDWEVMPEPGSSLDYTYEAGPPTRVSISANSTVQNINFKLTKTDALIAGIVVDASGAQLTSFFGYAMAMGGTGDEPMPGPGTEVRGGAFSLKVPHGTWTVNVDTPPGSNYSSTGGQIVTVGVGETKSVSITVKPNDAAIAGAVKDEKGAAITGKRIEVFAHAPGGSFKHTEVNTTTGKYSLGVLGGTSWYIGVNIEPGSGYMALPPDDNKTTVAAGQTVSKDFTLLTADATISGKVLDPNGNLLSNVYVFADSNFGKSKGVTGEFKGFGVHTGDMVKQDGTFSLAVPAGTYGVGSGGPSSLGYISPDIQEVTVSSGSTVSGITLQYKASDATIKGSIYLNGVKNKAFVWAWSEEGSFSETMSFSGDYTLNVTSGETWHIGADFESGNKYYQSDEHIISPIASSGSVIQDLTLVESAFDLPNPVSKTFNATMPTTITLDNGMTVSIPANALASSGTVTVTVTPTSQLAKQRTSRPVAYGYDITAFGSTGEITSKFNANVTITIPYTDAMLTALGITEADLAAAYFSNDSSLWNNVTSVIIDKDNNKVTLTVDHFTSFALVTGAADTTAPSSPTSLAATGSAGKVTLAWVNPTEVDFDKIKIYRSTASGTRGDLLHTTTSNPGTSYEDTNVSAGTTYYYTLTALDTTGNESTGTSQVTAAPTAELPATGVSVSAAIAFYFERLLILVGLILPFLRR